MKIFINAYLVVGGGIQVGNAIINELRFHPEHEYYIVCSKQVAQTLDDINDYPDFMHFKVFSLPAMIIHLYHLFHFNPFFDRCIKEFSADVAFTVFGPSYWKPSVPHLCGYARPIYIYTLSPFFKSLTFLQRLKINVYKKIHLKSFDNDSDMLVTENPDVSEKLSVICPHSKVVTVFSCCNPVFDNPEHQKSYDLPPFNGITLLTIAANYPHKNYKVLPMVASYLRKEYPDLRFRFVVSLQERELPVPDELVDCFVYVGKVSIQNLPSFYKQSDFMILPTLLECFSASWIDAMKCSVPILTSDLPFSHGICGKAAVYFNPEDPEDIGKKIASLASDKDEQKRLIEQGKEQLTLFNNNSTRTSSYLSLMESIVNTSKNTKKNLSNISHSHDAS